MVVYKRFSADNEISDDSVRVQKMKITRGGGVELWAMLFADHP